MTSKLNAPNYKMNDVLDNIHTKENVEPIPISVFRDLTKGKYLDSKLNSLVEIMTKNLNIEIEEISRGESFTNGTNKFDLDAFIVCSIQIEYLDLCMNAAQITAKRFDDAGYSVGEPFVINRKYNNEHAVVFAVPFNFIKLR